MRQMRVFAILWAVLAGLALLTLALSAKPLFAQSDTPLSSVAIVRGQGGTLLDDSGQQMKTALPGGSLVTLLGRSEDGALLYVESEANGSGWIMASSLLAMGVNSLPVRGMGDNVGTTVTTSAQSTSSAGSAGGASFMFPTPTPVGSTSAADESSVAATVALGDSRLNLRSGPGTAYAIVAKAEPGSAWQVMGRNEAGDWLQVSVPDTDIRAWAASEYLAISGSALLSLPVRESEVPAPAPTPVIVSQANAPVYGASSGSSLGDTQSQVETGSASGGATGLTGTLVFQDRVGGTVYAYDLDTDALRTVTSGVDPAISNDGSMIAFTRDGGGMGVYVVDMDGSGERILFGEGNILRSPKWSPDDQWIVFSRSTGFEECRALNGGVCLSDDAIFDTLPDNMRGGEAKNAIRALPFQREYFYTLARIGLDGGGYRDIPALTKAQAPDWNEAGITYYSGMAGIQITEDTDNARSVEVANDDILGYYQDPDWQPGGGQIVFQRQMNGQHWQIFAVNPDGTGLTALTRPVTALVDALPSNVSPAWSPDGKHIVYLSNRNSIESAGAWHLWVMNADGSEQRMLPIDVPLEYTYAGEQMVSWGPSL